MEHVLDPNTFIHLSVTDNFNHEGMNYKQYPSVKSMSPYFDKVKIYGQE